MAPLHRPGDRPRLPGPGDLRAADRAVRLRPGRGARRALCEAGGPVGIPPLRHHGPIHRRPLAGDLGSADSGGGRRPLARLLDRDRRPTGPRVGLHRRQARPGTGAGQRRAVRVSIPAARDRDRLPALRQDRPGDPHRRGRNHGRLRAAVLPRGAKPRNQHPRGVLRRGGAGARSAAPDHHSPLCALERDPERARVGDPERRGRDPHPGGARLPRLRDSADPGGRVGVRHQPCNRRRRRRDLVDGPVARAWR